MEIMKYIYTLFVALSFSFASAQEFDKHLATAKSAYAAGNLENARFALQQMMTEIDIQTGKEVLKILPSKMDNMDALVKADNVAANAGIGGVIIHREYAAGERTASLEMMGNSPMLASINAILSMPFVANSGDGTQKVVKVSGYKALLQKNTDTESNKTSYDLQVPFGSTLLTFRADDVDEGSLLKMADTIPLAEIVKKMQ